MRVVFFGVLLIFCGCLSAQEKTSNPTSRWLTTLGLGLDLADHENDRKTPVAVRGFSARNQYLAVHYRTNRFLDIGIQLSFQQEFRHGFRSLSDPISGLQTELNFQSTRRNIIIGLQPRLNYRVGQGDLALSLTVGRLRHVNQTRLNNPALGQANLRSLPIQTLYREIKLGYTYWPTVRFGIELSIVSADQQLRISHQNVTNEGNYRFEPLDFINLTEAIDPDQLNFRVLDEQFLFLNLAVVYHW